MLTQLNLTDFQSHKRTRLNLGPFTVIVGSSSAGKTAVIRGLKVLAQNSRGTAYVRNGASRARVEAFSGESGLPLDAQIRVAVERGKSISAYELQLPSDDTQTFTKCGTSTPESIQAALDFGDGELWLAGQFDRPFLLDETGSHIARVLGELTNVTMIYASVRELNKRASAAKHRETSITADIEVVKDNLRGYVGLRDQVAACTAAEAALGRAQRLSDRLRAVRVCAEDAEEAASRVVNARAALRPVPDISSLLYVSERWTSLASLVSGLGAAQARRDSISLVHIPDIAHLSKMSSTRSSLVGLLEELSGAATHLAESRERASRAAQECTQARSRLGTVLLEAGECPVCGADAVHAQMDRIGH